jgi:hypothetical protein
MVLGRKSGTLVIKAMSLEMKGSGRGDGNG